MTVSPRTIHQALCPWTLTLGSIHLATHWPSYPWLLTKFVTLATHWALYPWLVWKVSCIWTLNQVLLLGCLAIHMSSYKRQFDFDVKVQSIMCIKIIDILKNDCIYNATWENLTTTSNPGKVIQHFGHAGSLPVHLLNVYLANKNVNLTDRWYSWSGMKFVLACLTQY